MSTQSDKTILEQADKFSGNSHAWEDVAAASIRGLAFEELEPSQLRYSVEERIEHSTEVVRQVQNHVGQLAIFYHRFEETPGSRHLYRALTAIVPHKSRPFRLSTAISSTPRLCVAPARHTEGGKRQIATQAVFFSDRTSVVGIQSDPKTRPHETDPDNHFTQDSRGNRAIAIGSTAVSKLITSLAQEPGIRRGRLLGAYLRIGEMSVRFGAPLPAVPALTIEAERAEADIKTAMLIAETTTHIDNTVTIEARTLLDRFVSSREHLMTITQRAAQQSDDGVLPYVGDTRPMPHMTPVGAHEQFTLNQVIEAIESEGREYARRQMRYAAQLKILEAIKG